MLSTEIIESDEFCSFPVSTQAIYIHLNMNADDDGVVCNWKSIIRGLRSKKEFLTPLIDGGYLIMLENESLLIADWQIHNQIRRDRYVIGRHEAELNELFIKRNGRYVKKTRPAR